MFSDLVTIAIQRVTTFEVILAVVVLAFLLYRHRHAFVVYWTVTMSLTVVFSFVLSRASGIVYSDPRPDTVIHLKPLLPFESFLPHVAGNSFPSGHAMLTALIVVAVLLVSKRWSIPFILLGLIVNRVRVGGGSHHLIDIAGSFLMVGISVLVAMILGSVIAAVLLPSIPPSWSAEQFRLRRPVYPAA
ncbi:MAG: hypothetical protein NVSMB52_08030 [Chloroflexota bacterium]